MSRVEQEDSPPALAWLVGETRQRVLGFVLCALSIGCGGSTPGPTAPSPGGYSGQWDGTTAQGMPIAFTVSPDDRVTSITVGYRFNSCSGSQMFPNLNLQIAPPVQCIPAPCPPGLLPPSASLRTFAYSAGSISGPITSMDGTFSSTTRAEGSLDFRNYPGCGSANGVGWTASRR
jgi:hypothetical protein